MVANVIKLKALWGDGGLRKFALPGCILLLGVLLLLLPGKEQEKQTEPLPEATAGFSLEDFSRDLEQRLGGIQGAGEVHVLLTLEDEGTYEDQQDRNQSQGSDTAQTQEETVLSRQDGSDLPVTRRYSFPTFRGAMVLCPGAGSPGVELEIKEAVASLTGLGMDRICVCQSD